MIGRLWKGWTEVRDADAYEHLLRAEIVPGIGRIEGHRGAYVLRRRRDDGVEFAVLNLFESLEALRAFAGDEYHRPVISPEAGRLLRRYDPEAEHFEVVVAPPD